MDGPIHFMKNGRGLEDLPLDATIGPCRVLELQSGGDWGRVQKCAAVRWGETADEPHISFGEFLHQPQYYVLPPDHHAAG